MNKVIFIIDDDPDSVDMLADVLTAPNREICKFTDSLKAIAEIVDSGRVDVVVTDLDMPWIDGREVVRAARLSHPEMSAIVVSGAVRGCDVAASAGVAFLSKPVDVDLLRRMVDEVLGEREIAV